MASEHEIERQIQTKKLRRSTSIKMIRSASKIIANEQLQSDTLAEKESNKVADADEKK